MRMGSPRFKSVVMVALLALFLVPGCFAQSAGAEPARASQSGGPADAKANSRPAGDEDETAQFKHSASVELLAKLTGLGPESVYWLAVIFNFAIVIGIVVWFSKKSLPAMFRGRTNMIQKALEEGRRASEDANRRLGDIESRLARLDDEISQMRATMEKEASVEESRIRVAADEEAQRIVHSAEQEIALAARTARRELTEYAADLAVSLATKRLQIDGATDQMLVRRFLRQLSADGRSGKA